MAKKTEVAARPRTVRASYITENFNLGKGTIYQALRLYESSKGREGLRSIKIPGRQGRRGSRLFYLEDVEAWIASHVV